MDISNQHQNCAKIDPTIGIIYLLAMSHMGNPEETGKHFSKSTMHN
jgi:hypothetical protein